MVCRLILSRVASPEVNVGGCQVVDGLAVTMVVVVIDKGTGMIEAVGTSDQYLLNVNLQPRTPTRLPVPTVASNLAITRNEIRLCGGANPVL